MRIIRPATIDNLDMTLESTNVAVGYSEYNAGTTYASDDIVYSSTTNRLYQALTDGESGNSLSNAAKWLDLGPTNPYRMFDQSNSSQTTNADSVDVTVSIDGRADSVSVLNMVAATVQIIMSTDLDGELYNETFNLVSDGGVNNWYEYFFEPVSRKGDLTIYDLPMNADPTFQVIVSEPGDTAYVGSLVIGQSLNIGNVIHPSSISIQDYSRKETNEFGDFTIIERSFAKLANYKITIDPDKVDSIATTLALYRATPVVFVGVEAYTSTWIYGFYKDWRIQFTGPNEYYLDMEMEGLT